MSESRLTIRFEGGVSGVSGPASFGRDGGVETVLSAGVLSTAGIETVGAPEMFELDPATVSRGAEWSGRSGIVEVEAEIERQETELLLVRCGTTGYRAVAPSVSVDRLVYRVPVAPGPGADRGLVAGAIRWVVQKVVMPTAADVGGRAGAHLIQRWEAARRPSRMRFFTPQLYRARSAEPAEPDQLRGGRVLVLVHGLNAQAHDLNGFGAMPVELVAAMNEHYGRVLAFDHPTLATSPAANARELRDWLQASGAGQVDFLCHSRGGIVVRSLLESELSGLDLDVGSVVFVATPHRGTPLAAADHLSGLVDRLLTLALAMPDNPITMAVEGALTIASGITANVYDRLSGVRALRPVADGNDFLGGLSAQPPNDVRYRTIASDFEPIPGSGWWHAWRDRGVDVVFEGLPNDAIVPTLSALQVGDHPGEGFADIALFDDLDAIPHSRYFDSPLVEPLLHAWLGGGGSPLTQQLRSRLRTRQAVESLAALGPDWSLAQRIADFTCLAPPDRRPALHDKVKKYGARVWSAVTRADDPARPIVVVLPGIMGSELAAANRRIWLSPWQLAQGGFDRLALNGSDPVTATELLCFAYRQLLERMQKTYDVVEYPYDWRRPIDDAARSLLGVLREAVAEIAGSPRVIHIVAHSMGGLVVRRARQLAADEGDDRELFDQLGGKIVLLGTPNHGSFSTPLALLGSHPLVRHLARLDVRNGRRQWLELMWTFPGLVELLPDPRGIATESGEPAALDWLYQPDSWPQAQNSGLQRILSSARAFHERLRECDGHDLHVVLGDGLPTPTGLRLGGESQFDVEMADDGDGTVSVTCGLLPLAHTWYAHGTSHGDLVRDQKVLAAVDEILSERTPSFLRPMPHGASRADAITARPAGKWMTPAEAESVLDGSGVSTRGAPVRPDPMAWTRRDVTAAGLTAVSAYLGRPHAEELPDLAISVTHGSLESAQHPVIVGHATGTPIAGAEARCDAMLNGELSDLHVLGNYPDGRDTFLYVPKTRPTQRIEGCIVVALDSTAPLSTAELAEQVCRAVVDFAERRRWERAMRAEEHAVTGGDHAPLGVSTVPLGSGPAVALGLERSVDAVVAGVMQANLILRTRDRPRIRQLEFVERYAARVERIMWELQRLQARVNASSTRLGKIDLGLRQIVQGEGALEGTPPPGYESGRWERLSIDVAPEARRGDQIRPLMFRFARDRAAVSDRPRRVDRLVVAELLKEAVSRPSRCVSLGAVLFEELLPAELKDELARTDNLVLQVDEMTADIPWELLVDRLAGDEPLACRSGLLRQFRTTDFRPRTATGVARSALVFGDPPTGLVPLPGARQEAREVWQLMRSRQVDAQILEFNGPNSKARSTAAQIKEAFRARDHRVIHIAAHGLYRVVADESPDGPRIEGGVAIGDGAFLTADDFSNLRIAPDLVFLNCCHLGRARIEGEEDTGLLGPIDQHQAAASIAKQLMDIGVRAVIVAGWAVDDHAARTFAHAFYESIFDGVPFGEAVRNARLLVYQQSESTNNTWAAYQCYGDPGFQLAPPKVGGDVGGELPIRAAARRQLEELYVRAGETTDVEGLVRDLSAVDSEIVRRWPADGELIAHCGLVWADIGHYEKAIDRYQLAAASESGASLATIEQLVNLSARQALNVFRNEDGRIDEDLLEVGRHWAGIMAQLPPTSERHAIAGSFEKRLAVLNPQEWHRHVSEAIRSYVASACLSKARFAPSDRSLYGFMNALQLATIADDDDDLVRELITIGWIKRWIRDLTTDPPHNASFWDYVAPTDCTLTAALVPVGSKLAEAIMTQAKQLDDVDEGDLEKLRCSLERRLDDGADTAIAIARAYRRTKPRARTRNWHSVVENIDLLRDLAQAGGRTCAAGLNILAEEIRQDDADDQSYSGAR